MDEPEVVASADSDHATVVTEKVASTQRQCAGDAEDSCDQPDISMFPFVTVSPCRRKATPLTQRQSEASHPDDGVVQCHADNVQSSSTSTVASGSCGGWTSPSPTVSSTWMSPARVTSCTAGPDAPSPGIASPKDSSGTPQSSPGGLATVPRSPDTISGVVPGSRSPVTSTPAAGARVDVIKVPVYSPVYRDHAPPSRRQATRPGSPRRCSVVVSHTDVLDLSPSRKSHQQQPSRPGNHARRAIAFSESQRDRQKIVRPPADAASVPPRSPDEQTTESLVRPCSPAGSLNRRLSVTTNSPPRGDESESRPAATTSVVVCERQEADSASLSPSKPFQPPTPSQATTTVEAAALFAAATATTVQSPLTTDSVMSACSSRLVVNLQRCDLSPTSVALPGRTIGAGKRRNAVVGGGRPSTSEDLAAPSKRRRLKLMCNGMTIYRDIDDVAASAPSRVRAGKYAAAARRRASLPTFPVASLSNSVVKRRHVSTDDVIGDQETLAPPSVEVMSSPGDSGLARTSTESASDGDSVTGPLDYSTDRSSIGTVPTDSGVPSSVPDSSLTFDEPLELTTEQVRERQKNDCLQHQTANQFAVC